MIRIGPGLKALLKLVLYEEDQLQRLKLAKH